MGPSLPCRRGWRAVLPPSANCCGRLTRRPAPRRWTLAAAIGLSRLSPLEVRNKGSIRPVILRAAADAAPFDPAELLITTERV